MCRLQLQVYCLLVKEKIRNLHLQTIGFLFSLQKGGDVNKLYEMGSEPERRYFLNRLLSFLEERSAPLNNMPSISKQPLDLYRLYLHVQERGGMLEVNTCLMICSR